MSQRYERLASDFSGEMKKNLGALLVTLRFVHDDHRRQDPFPQLLQRQRQAVEQMKKIQTTMNKLKLELATEDESHVLERHREEIMEVMSVVPELNGELLLVKSLLWKELKRIEHRRDWARRANEKVIEKYDKSF